MILHWLLPVAIFLQQFFILKLPFFQKALSEAAFANILCGLSSDLMAMLWCFLLFSPLTLLKPSKSLTAFSWILAFVSSVAFTMHVRYFEHFGMQVRWMHFFSLGGGFDLYNVGLPMLLESRNALLYFVLLWVISFTLMQTKKHTSQFFWSWVRGNKLRSILLFAFLFSVLNTTVINARYRLFMHPELRYNPFSSLYYNWKADQEGGAAVPPTVAQGIELQKMLGGARDFAKGAEVQNYPLWQNSTVKEDLDSPKEGLQVFEKLRAFIQEGEKKRGPWNIVLVLLESYRAHEISNPALPKDLTPNLTKIIPQGISFQEAYSVGLQTSIGQLASTCSMYTTASYNIMVRAPMMQLVCLPDIFAQKGWETFFFYPSDNHFDNQDVFYSQHHVHKIVGEEFFPKDSAKSGWGLSDHELYNLSLQKFKDAKKPFYASILTLTNHPPYKVPSDVPEGVVDGDAPVYMHQILQYVDWAIGDFYAKVEKEFPHTLVFFLADHGIFSGEPAEDSPDPRIFRQVARMPFVLLSPEFPKDLQNVRLNHLVSNVDLAPTVLGLLGWEDTPQQFMGINAFIRSSPSYIIWQGKMRQISIRNHQLETTSLNPQFADTLSALARFNLLAPRQSLSSAK